MLEDYHKDEQILPVGYMLAGRYLLDTFLGSGGMGAVYLAQDRLLEDKLVAIKVLHKEFSKDSELTRRFLREVNMMHSVNHPNVVRTYDAGVQDGMFFFTMEYIEGLLLDRYLETLGRDYALLGKITAQICKGLEAIHNQNIVHRDLKPGNILVSNDGTVKITDFGVARPVSSGHTAHREIMGSLDYIPPEVFQGNQITPASDFYSLGIILYGIVCGVFPFDAEDPMAIVWKHVNEIPITPSSRNPEVPPWMDKLIMRLLEKDPSKRPQNARQVIRFVRENVYKDGKILDSATHEVSKASESMLSDTTVHDTDVFELDFELSDLEPSNLDDDSFMDGPSLRSDSFTSACNQLIFNALPTVDNIRQHEEMWEERKKRRAEGHDLKGLAAKIKHAEKNDEMKKLRIVLQVMGFVVVFSVVVAMFASSGTEQEESEDTQKTSVSIHDLRKDYLSGKADETKQKLKSKPKKSSGWGLDSLFKETYDAESLQTLSFSRLNSIKSNYDYLSGESPRATQTTSYGAPVGEAPSQINNIEERSLNSRREVQQQVLTQPAISTVYQGFQSSVVNSENLAAEMQEPTAEQKARFIEKRNIRENLATVNGQLDAYSIQDEESLAKKDLEVQTEIEKIKKFQSSIDSHLTNQIDKQRVLNSFIADLDKGGVIKVAKELSKVDEKVSERLQKYEQSQESYSEMMDSIKDGKLAVDKIAVSEVSKELERQRDELNKTLKRVINNGMITGFKELVGSGVLSDVTKEKTQTLDLERNSRKTFWEQLKSGKAEDKSVLENKKQELEKRLNEIEKELPTNQESSLRGLIAVESHNTNTK